MEQNLSRETRTESDLIGSREVPADALYGVQTLRDSCERANTRVVKWGRL